MSSTTPTVKERDVNLVRLPFSPRPSGFGIEDVAAELESEAGLSHDAALSAAATTEISTYFNGTFERLAAVLEMACNEVADGKAGAVEALVFLARKVAGEINRSVAAELSATRSSP